MKEFEKINAGNVTLVKSAIANKKAVVLVSDEDCNDMVIEYNDIQSLYDHDNLFIFRFQDRYFVAQLMDFYMKDKDTVVVHVNPACMHCLDKKFKAAGIGEDNIIYQKAKDIFDKRDQLQEKLNKKIEEDAKVESEIDPDDIFSILGSDTKEEKPSSLFDLLFPPEFREEFRKFKEENEDELKNQARKEYDDFKKNNGRMPNTDEVIDMVIKNNLINKDISDSEKERIKSVISNHPMVRLMKLVETMKK